MISKYMLFIAGALAFGAIYFGYCNNCITSCVVFTDQLPSTCNYEGCRMCAYVDNRFKNWLNWWHTDDYSYKLTDDPVCKDNYADTPIITELPDGKSKPNIILFVLDDLDEMISPYFEAMPFAQKLFQQNGTHFTNGFTSTSFCCPARCQIFTGMYGHNNGVISSYGSYSSVDAFRKPLYLNGTRQTNKLGQCINNEKRSVPLFLQKFGNYKTAIFGKYLNGFENDIFSNVNYVPEGWDQFDIGSNNYQYIGNMYVMTEWDSDKNNLKYKWHGTDEQDYLTDVISRRSVNFIDKHRLNGQTNPLFMYVAPTAPHFPQTAAKRHMHKLKYWDDRFEEIVASRPNYHSHESLKTKSRWISHNSELRDDILNITAKTCYGSINFNIHRLEFRKRMGTLYALDEMFEAVYNKIKELGELDNTIFGLVSDNGFNLGSHKLYHKMSANDESVRIPFYLSGLNFKKNVVDTRLVLLNDLAPTFLSLANFVVPDHMDGIDLTTDQSRRGILLEYGKLKAGEEFTGNLNRAAEFKMIVNIAPKTLGYDVQPYIGIRTHDYLLVMHYNKTYDEVDTEYELYDMKTDPYQIVNVYSNDTYRDVATDLKVRLFKLAHCSNKKECSE